VGWAGSKAVAVASQKWQSELQPKAAIGVAVRVAAEAALRLAAMLD
jgi:hypothetical protein